MAIIINLFNKLALFLWEMGSPDPFVIHREISKLRGSDNTSINQGDVVETELKINGVSAQLYMPSQRSHSGILIYFHGGGYVMGSPQMYSPFTTELARSLECPVISVDYRLAPQYPHPHGLDDCVEVVKYIFNEGHQQLQVDPTKIVIAGDSAGGYFAAATAVKLGETLKLKGLGLIVPILQHITFNTPSHLENKDVFDLPRSMYFLYSVSRLNLTFTRQEYDSLVANNHTDFTIREKYANKYGLPLLSHRGPQHMDGGGDPSTIEMFKHLYEDPIHSPLFADLSHFPPTVVLSAEYDILRDDSVMFVQRMKSENRSVEEIRMNSVHSAFLYSEDHLPATSAMTAWKKSLREVFN
jgi:acetyl esterase/lipase